jgi:uncharacterized protein (TIGR02266 family)
MNIRDNQRFAKDDRTYSVLAASRMSETPPPDQRGPTNLRIKFRSASLEQFIERYAVDVSRGGIFIRTREPLAVGTLLRLELQLQDGTPLLAGDGTVIWIRESDPARPTVPPGMAVRFDTVTPETQPTLDRILAERAQMEEAGRLPAQQTGGFAVRRPSAVLPSLDNSGRVSALASNAPTAPVEAPGAGAADTGRTGPSAVSKTSFLGSRAAGGGTPAPAGPFSRARTTGTRPVPVPSALFEPPSAADIDKALSALEEAPGAAPMPPMPSVPRFVSEDISNEPTRVGDLSAEAAAAARASSGPTAAPLAEGAQPPDGPAAAGSDAAPESLETSPPAAPPAEGDAAAETSAEKAAVSASAPPDVSRRFRAASRAYPTLQRRRGTTVVIALFLLLGAGGLAVWKLRPGMRVPARPVTIPAGAVVPPPAPPPAPAAAPAEPPAPPPAAPPEPEAKSPPAAEEKPKAEKRGAEASERASHKSAHHHARETESSHAESQEAAPAVPAAEKPAPAAPAAAPAPAPAPDKPAAEKPPAAAQPAADDNAPAVLKITSTPSGAEVSIDGSIAGETPFTTKTLDPGTPHAITVRMDGFETHERMIGASDWSRPHGSAPPSLKMNIKLRRLAPVPNADAPKGAAPADDNGGPSIKEVNPGAP